jgi:thiol-disulfide isomerase/thioredoxin
MRKVFAFLASVVFFGAIKAQGGYDIKIDLKNCKDTTVYLVVHFWESNNIIDSCKKVKNGQIRFKGNKDLDKGLYILVNQEKNTSICEFFVDEGQKFSLSADQNDVNKTLKAGGSRENEQFFAYNKFFAEKNSEFEGYLKQAKGKSKEDSTKFITEKIKALNVDARKFDSLYKIKNKGTFLLDFLNLKTEKYATDIPKNLSDSEKGVYQYYYYRNHFWDGVNFKDDRLIRTPYFDDRIKKYFETVVVQHPDTIIMEIDKMLAKCDENSTIYKMLLGHFTYKYEQNKTMNFDKYGNSVTFEKVFIHMGERYILTGHAKGVYTEETIKAINKKVIRNKPLLPGNQAPDFNVIDTTDAKVVSKMRFDTCKTSESLSRYYYSNEAKLKPMFKNLHGVKAKYTVLVFWASDCGHCKTDIPKLNDSLAKAKGKIDFKVFAVQTKDDYAEWTKFIRENKLDFINVYDPIHLNSFADKYDVESTPVIFILDKDKRVKVKRVGVGQVLELLELFERIEKDQKKPE